jgi:hypothetical protein
MVLIVLFAKVVKSRKMRMMGHVIYSMHSTYGKCVKMFSQKSSREGGGMVVNEMMI